jgi:hypothetical protein
MGKSSFWHVKIATGAYVLPPKKIPGNNFSTFVNFRVTATDRYAMSLLINGLFARSRRLPCEMQSLFLWGNAQKIIFRILNICLWLFFSYALILNENPH